MPIPGDPAEIEAALSRVIATWGYTPELKFDAARMVEHALWLEGAESVLDIGGGFGLFAPLCAALGARATILDSFHPYSEGRRLRSDVGFTKLDRLGVDVVEHDALDVPLPFADGAFDAVTSFDAMEHFHNSPRPLFRDVERVGSPSARFVLGVPNAVNLRKRLAVPFGKTNWSRFDDWYEPEQFEGHVREPVVADLRRIAADMRLEDWRIVGRNWLGYQGGRVRSGLTRVSDRALRLRPALCANIYLLGRLPSA